MYQEHVDIEAIIIVRELLIAHQPRRYRATACSIYC